MKVGTPGVLFMQHMALELDNQQHLSAAIFFAGSRTAEQKLAMLTSYNGRPG